MRRPPNVTHFIIIVSPAFFAGQCGKRRAFPIKCEEEERFGLPVTGAAGPAPRGTPHLHGRRPRRPVRQPRRGAFISHRIKKPFSNRDPRIVNITTVNLFARRRGRRLITSVRPSGLVLSKDTNLPNSSSQNWFYDLDGRYARCITSRCRHVDGIPRLLMLPAADPPPAAPTSFIYKSSLSPDFQMFLPGCRHTSEQRLQRCRLLFIHNVCLTLQWQKSFLINRFFFSSKRPHHPSHAVRSSIDNA